MFGLKVKLALMMFLQFFIWGAWFEIGFDYIPALGFDEVVKLPFGIELKWQLPLLFGAFNFGALVSLFFSAQFADRKFAAEKFLAFSHLIGGIAIGGLFFLHPLPEDKAAFWPFFGLMLMHSLFYVPTISITNSIAFANLKDPSREFGPVRVWGTIGWIAASYPFIFILVDWAKVPALADVGFVEWMGKALGTSLKGDALRGGQKYVFLVAGMASVLLAGFSLLLPHTPPKPASGVESLAWVKAFKHLLWNPYLWILFLVTFVDAAVHQSYFYWTFGFLTGPVGIEPNWAGPVMKIGQVAEILTMLVLGFVLKSLGWRLTMTIGVLGHAARFAVFAFFPNEYACMAVIALHGVCYAFFFATVYIFVDEVFPKDIRSSAQGLFNVLILGVGPFVANTICGELRGWFTTDGVLDYSSVFRVSMGAAVFGAILLFVGFHPPKTTAMK